MSKFDEFDGLEIEDMFNSAVASAEDTGEEDPNKYSKNPPKLKKKPKPKPKPRPEPKPEPRPEPKPEPRPEPEVQEKPAVARRKERLGPLNRGSKSADNTNVSVKSIGKIIEMKETLDNYSQDELDFVHGYFKINSENYSEVIYEALTANRRHLDALNNIVIAREHSSAERAFYLMELTNIKVENIYYQVNLIMASMTGEDEFGEVEKVNESNKIKICRTLENIISEMDTDIFAYIDKLQKFTNIAISE